MKRAALLMVLCTGGSCLASESLFTAQEFRLSGWYENTYGRGDTFVVVDDEPTAYAQSNGDGWALVAASTNMAYENAAFLGLHGAYSTGDDGSELPWSEEQHGFHGGYDLAGTWTFVPTQDVMFLATVAPGNPLFSSIVLTDVTTSAPLIDAAWPVGQFVDVDPAHTYTLSLALWNDARANSSLGPGSGEDWLTVLLVDGPETVPCPHAWVLAACGVGLVRRLRGRKAL